MNQFYTNYFFFRCRFTTAMNSARNSIASATNHNLRVDHGHGGSYIPLQVHITTTDLWIRSGKAKLATKAMMRTILRASATMISYNHVHFRTLLSSDRLGRGVRSSIMPVSRAYGRPSIILQARHKVSTSKGL